MKRQRVGHDGCFRCCGTESAASEAGIDSGTWMATQSPKQNISYGVDAQLDRMLAADMNSLTLEEREKVFEDIHGIRQLPAETEKFVSEQLRSV